MLRSGAFYFSRATFFFSRATFLFCRFEIIVQRLAAFDQSVHSHYGCEHAAFRPHVNMCVEASTHLAPENKCNNLDFSCFSLLFSGVQLLSRIAWNQQLVVIVVVVVVVADRAAVPGRVPAWGLARAPGRGHRLAGR